jgi:ribonuclease H2 subunit B
VISRVVSPSSGSMLSQCTSLEITSEIVVYRLSLQKIVEYLRLKVARLATPEVLEVSRTLTRGLAKDGLMEDGKESLLNSKCCLYGSVQPLTRLSVGRIRAACDLLAQYLSTTTLAALLASYECVIFARITIQRLTCLPASPILTTI